MAFRATYAANLQRGPELLAIHDALSSELDLLGTPPAMDDAAVETEEDAAWWECLDRVIGTAVDYAKRGPHRSRRWTTPSTVSLEILEMDHAEHISPNDSGGGPR